MIIEHRLTLCSPTPSGVIYDFACANAIIDQVSSGKCVVFPKNSMMPNGSVPIASVSGTITNVYIENNELVFVINLLPGEFKTLVNYWKNREQQVPYYLTTEISADIDLDDNQVQSEGLLFLGISWNTDRENF